MHLTFSELTNLLTTRSAALHHAALACGDVCPDERTCEHFDLVKDAVHELSERLEAACADITPKPF